MRCFSGWKWKELRSDEEGNIKRRIPRWPWRHHYRPAVPAARSLSDESKTNLCLLNGLPCGSDGREPAHNARDPGLSPGHGWGGSPGEGNGYPLQYSCLENSMDRGAGRAVVHGIADSGTWLSDLHLSSKQLLFGLFFFFYVAKFNYELVSHAHTISKTHVSCCHQSEEVIYPHFGAGRKT